MGLRKLRKLKLSDLSEVNKATLESFIPHPWDLWDLRTADIRPLLGFLKERFDEALRIKEEDLSAFVEHFKAACQCYEREQREIAERDQLPLEALPEIPDTPIGRLFRAFVDMQVCNFVNEQFMRPGPLPEIREIRMRSRMTWLSSDPRPLFRCAGQRGNPNFQVKCPPEEVARLACELVEGPGREAYRVRYFPSKRRPNQCYPLALKRALAEKLGVSERTIDRCLDEAEFEMPDSLVYR